MPRPRFPALLCALALFSSCDSGAEVPVLSKTSGRLELGRQVPRVSERDVVGSGERPVMRDTAAFRKLRVHSGLDIVFKDEEATGADRVMTRRLQTRLGRLNRLVQAEWEGVRLRVTEAWDEDREHGPESTHYEGRAADLTTSDLDHTKLGRLAFLAVEAGFDWVYFESRTHVHVSVKP